MQSAPENSLISRGLQISVFCLAFVTVAVGANRTSKAPSAESDQDRVARYLRYSRTLTRLTDEKIKIAFAATTLCIDPRTRHGPHFVHYINLYASPDAVAARRGGAKPLPHPVGTLFVKEKFEAEPPAKPTLITVMEKVTNTASADDWSYTMIRLSDRSIVRDGFRVSCASCHSHYETTDFITRETDALLSLVAIGGSNKKR